MITFCTYLVAMKIDLFLGMLLGTLNGVDKKVGFRQAIDDEQYAFSCSGSRVKHCTPYLKIW